MNEPTRLGASIGLANASSLHTLVREKIAKRISSGLYEPGQPIPSTAALSEEFGVSQITVKRAIKDLQASGTVVSMAGKGTFVKEQRRFIRELDVWMTSLDNAKHLGFTPSIKLVSITKEKIADPTMSVFSPPEEAMFCVRKIFSVDNMPLMYDLSYLPTDTDPDLLDQCGEKFIYDVLKQHGHEVINTRIVIDASPASADAQDAFSIPTGYPTIRRFYHLTSSNSSVSVFGFAESPFDRLACSINLPNKNPEI